MDGYIDTSKKLTKKVPFYSIHRDTKGLVDVCIASDDKECKKCMFYKKCKLQ
jgi:hypothetical protein